MNLKHNVRIATWNVQTLTRPGSATLLSYELSRYNISIAGNPDGPEAENALRQITLLFEAVLLMVVASMVSLLLCLTISVIRLLAGAL